MGWTGVYDCHDTSSRGRKEYLNNEFTFSRNEERDGKKINFETAVLDSSMVGTTYYAAVQTKDYVNDKTTVWGLVCLTSVEGNEFLFNSFDETEGPYYYDCPKRILDKLTPTENEYANKWRAGCYEQIEKKKADRQNPCNIKNLAVGDRVYWTPTSKNWSGGIKAGETYTLEKYVPFGGKQAKWHVRELGGTVSPRDIPLREIRETKDDVDEKLPEREVDLDKSFLHHIMDARGIFLAYEDGYSHETDWDSAMAGEIKWKPDRVNAIGIKCNYINNNQTSIAYPLNELVPVDTIEDLIGSLDLLFKEHRHSMSRGVNKLMDAGADDKQVGVLINKFNQDLKSIKQAKENIELQTALEKGDVEAIKEQFDALDSQIDDSERNAVAAEVAAEVWEDKDMQKLEGNER